jgi:hypothetical protein
MGFASLPFLYQKVCLYQKAEQEQLAMLAKLIPEFVQTTTQPPYLSNRRCRTTAFVGSKYYPEPSSKKS